MARLTTDPPRVNPLLLAFARRVRNLNKTPRREALRHVAEILPVVLAWIASRIERRQHGP